MNDYAASLLRYLGQNTLEASLLIGLILMARVLLGERLSARWQYALWFLVCIKILIPWSPSSAISLSYLVPETLSSSPCVDATLPASAYEETAAQASASMRWGLWSAILVWISGMAWIGIYLLRDYRRLTRLVNRGPFITAKPVLELLDHCSDQLHISTPVRLVITDAVKSPALLGMVRPKLLLPRAMVHTFTRRQLRHVFLHELAHLKRHDIAASCVASLCHAIHWFNPLVWYAFQQMRTDRELACDQLALTHLAQLEQPNLYGQTIIRILELNRCHPLRAALAGMGQTRHQVRRRIVSIADFRPSYEGIQWGAACLLACLAVTGLTKTQIPPGSPHAIQASVSAEVTPATQPDSLGSPVAPPVKNINPTRVAQKQETRTPQKPTVTATTQPDHQDQVMSSQNAVASSHQYPQGTLPNDIITMNDHQWYQAQLNALQFQYDQSRLYRQMTLQRQQAARQVATWAKLQHRRTTSKTPPTRRRRTTHDGITGIIQMAAMQTTYNR